MRLYAVQHDDGNYIKRCQSVVPKYHHKKNLGLSCLYRTKGMALKAARRYGEGYEVVAFDLMEVEVNE